MEKKRKFKKKISSPKVKVQSSDVLELKFWKGRVRSTLNKSLKSLKNLKSLTKPKENNYGTS